MIKFSTGANYPAVSDTIVKNSLIPLPPLKEQKRIAIILDKADAIRRKCQQAIDLADQFLRSVFLDMFGDPVTNPRGWSIVELKEFCVSVVDCPHSTPNYSYGVTTFPCLRSSDLQDGYLNFATTKYLNEEEYRNRVSRAIPKEGDIIYCREGARLGNLAMVPEGLTPCLGQRTMLMRADDSLTTSEYLLFLLNSRSVKNKILESVIGAAAPRVNIKDLMVKKFPLPPLDLQKQFSHIRKKLLELKIKEITNQSYFDHLYASLSFGAFRGELTQSKAA